MLNGGSLICTNSLYLCGWNCEIRIESRHENVTGFIKGLNVHHNYKSFIHIRIIVICCKHKTNVWWHENLQIVLKKYPIISLLKTEKLNCLYCFGRYCFCLMIHGNVMMTLSGHARLSECCCALPVSLSSGTNPCCVKVSLLGGRGGRGYFTKYS